MHRCNDEFQRQMVALLPRLRRFAYSLTHSLDDADDLVQSACEKALARRSQFDPASRMDSWMYRIIQNAWLDSRRSSSSRGHTSDENIVNALQADDRAIRSVEAGRELDAVYRCMQDMPDEQRILLSLVSIEGTSYKEAAQILDLPVGTVMSRLARGRRRLSEALSGDS